MHAATRRRVVTGLNKGKTIAVDMVKRGGRVKAAVVDRRHKTELQALVREHVEVGGAVFPNELLSYERLSADYAHQISNHAMEYVNGKVYTNTMENFWSLMKPQIHGTYVNVEPFQFFRNLDKQAFRYNSRKYTGNDPFRVVMSGITGKRLKYDALTGKDAALKTRSN